MVKIKYKCAGHHSVTLEFGSGCARAAAEIFAARKARQAYGKPGVCYDLGCTEWSLGSSTVCWIARLRCGCRRCQGLPGIEKRFRVDGEVVQP